MRIILIKNENAINKMTHEQRNKYLQKLENRREDIIDKITKTMPKEKYIIVKSGCKQEAAEKLKLAQERKREALNKELHNISNAIGHIRYLNRQDKCKQINERQDYAREF